MLSQLTDRPEDRFSILQLIASIIDGHCCRWSVANLFDGLCRLLGSVCGRDEGGLEAVETSGLVQPREHNHHSVVVNSNVLLGRRS